MIDKKNPGMDKGYLMSQFDVGAILGLHKCVISRTELSMLQKIRDGLTKHNVSEQEFFHYLKYLKV